jgi:AcrR family transcriptional regulator
MSGSTKERIVAAAAELLDAGGQEAVTLRSVAEKVGISHNAPYRHFADRNALLAGVAIHDFKRLAEAFEARAASKPAALALRGAAEDFIAYGLLHPARYRLLFSDPDLPASDALKSAAFAPFETLVAIVERGQREKALPASDPVRLGGMLFATIHGAIDLVIGGRATAAKGLDSAMATVELLLDLLGTCGTDV